MMKRSLNIIRRIDRSVEEKEGLLKDLEYTAPISLHPLRHPARQLMKLEKLRFGYDGRLIFDGLNLTVERGDRLALTGGNGSGKSTLISLMLGLLTPTGGQISAPGDLIISSLPESSARCTAALRRGPKGRGLIPPISSRCCASSTFPGGLRP